MAHSMVCVDEYVFRIDERLPHEQKRGTHDAGRGPLSHWDEIPAPMTQLPQRDH